MNMNSNTIEKMSCDEKERCIVNVFYVFHSGNFKVWDSSKVVKETKHFYFTESGHRYSKVDAVGKAIFRSAASYPYVEVILLNGTEDEARKILSDWFVEMSKRILTQQAA